MSAGTLTDERRARLHGRVKFIVFFTITWNVIEAIIALSAGAVASSAALIGFGLDSVIEVASAAAIAWQFTRKDPERWEKPTVRIIGIAFFALAAYVTVDAILALTGVREPDHSPVGIGIAIASLIVMPALAWFEFRTGRELGSKSVQADAKQLLHLPLRHRPHRPAAELAARVGVGGLHRRARRRRPRHPGRHRGMARRHRIPLRGSRRPRPRRPRGGHPMTHSAR